MMRRFLGPGLLAVACGVAAAQPAAPALPSPSAPGAPDAPGAPSPLVAAVRHALEDNPALAARLQAWHVAEADARAAGGALLPRVDAGAAAGTRELTDTASSPVTQALRVTQAELTVSQLLWDGQATQSGIERLEHVRMQRWFEFRDAAERTALDAARAWYDVVRYRQLVALAEDHYVQHRLAFLQVQARVQAGVGRGVDLSQVEARLALAQSEVLDTRAGLHAADEHFRRIVGETPPPGGDAPLYADPPLPDTADQAVAAATHDAPAVAAAIEGLRAARSALAARRGTWQPTLEARLRGAWGHNLDGYVDEKRDATAQLVLHWNLFDGGADVARIHRDAARLTQAEDERDSACRAVREEAVDAYDDVHRLDAQLRYLDRNVMAITHARDAYRQQFDIGRRSLLDLLNSETELYDARRTYVMAREDLDTAVVRAYAAQGTLVASLGLGRAGTFVPGAPDAPWQAGDDASLACPTAVPPESAPGFDALDARARALAEAPPGAAGAWPLPRGGSGTPAPAQAPARP